MDRHVYQYSSYYSSYTPKHKQNTNSNGLEITTKMFGEIEEIIDGVETRFNRFKNFDRIRDPPRDHRFLTNTLNNLKQFFSSGFRQKIEQEWDYLEKNLPNTPIFVRVYEKRFDLMRVVIIGPPGTPYHHGLFFFDVFFPCNYPISPPKLFHHSQVELNSNLPQDGTVRLPIFDSWCRDEVGKNNEKLNSGIMDVFRAINDLFFTSEPYILNESENTCLSHNNKSSKTVKKSELISNELTFLLMCQKMIWDLSDPPIDFRDFVMGHFRTRSHVILLKFKENMNDNYIMVEMFEKLYTLFERNGSYVGHYLGFLESKKQMINEKNKKYSEQEEARGRSNCRVLISKVVNKLQKNLAGYFSKLNFDN